MTVRELLTELRSILGEEHEITKLPPGTIVKDADGMRFSSWGGKLALVLSPGAAWRRSEPGDTWFNVEKMTRLYVVRPAMLNKQPIPAEEHFLGLAPIIPDHMRSKPYEQVTFDLHYDPHRGIRGGTFAKSEQLWLKLAPKDLAPGELATYMKHLREKGFKDVSDAKLSAKDWAEAFKMKDYDEVQAKSDHTRANAFDRVVYRSGEDDSKNWAEIKGVYATTKKGDLKFVVSR